MLFCLITHRLFSLYIICIHSKNTFDVLSEYAKFAGLAGHVQLILKNVRQRGLISPVKVDQE